MDGSVRWLDDEQQRVWRDLATVVIGLPTLLDRQLLRDSQITNFEYSVAARLSMTEALTMRLSDLAHLCNCTLPRLSKVMVRFERQGWVTRSPDPQDGRYTRATLTEAGLQKVVDSAAGHVEQVRRLVFDTLTPAQQRQLGVVLSRIAAPIRTQLHRH